MYPAKVILVTLGALQVALGVPVPNDSERIIMPGESFPITFDEAPGSAERDANYNDLPTRMELPSEVDSDPPVTEINGIKCGLPYGSAVVNDTCSRFLTQAHCSEGEWYVKNPEGFNGSCVPKPCPKGQLSFEGNCIEVDENQACSDGQMLYVELTGAAHCDCMPDYFYDIWSGKCYAEHDRGTCNFGKYLERTEDGGFKCVDNPCQMEGYKLNKVRGTCYKKQYRGICKPPNIALYHDEKTKTVECIVHSPHSIFDLPTMRSCPKGSIRDLRRRCREQFRVPTQNTYPSSYGICNNNFVRDARGICRKTHKLFG